jgi:hypothetical protein
MNLLRQIKGGTPTIILAIAVVLIAVAFFAIGRVTSQPVATAPSPTPTATRVVATPTPNLVLRSPHVLATFMLTRTPTCVQRF